MSLRHQATHINEPNAHVKRLNVLNVFGARNRLRSELSFARRLQIYVPGARYLSE